MRHYLFYGVLFCFISSSCSHDIDYSPNTSIHRGEESVSYFSLKFRHTEVIDTILVYIKAEKVLIAVNSLPLFKEHFMYIGQSVFDLNHFNQSSIIQGYSDDRRVREFKVYLDK